MRVVVGEHALCVPEGQQDSVKIKLSRLLAVDDHGEGEHYRWLGWASRPRGYRTTAIVVEVGERLCTLDLPEWGRGQLLETWTRLLPSGGRYPGARLSLRADLGAESGARLQPRDFELAGG